MRHCVYWVRHKDHTDICSQGYVGVSNNSRRRFKEYRKFLGNTHLNNAIKKYGIDNILMSELLVADNGYCLQMERALRPSDGIGWNLTAGGGYPPRNNAKPLLGKTPWNKGKKHTEEHKSKTREASLRTWSSPEYRERVKNVHVGRQSPMLGKKHSPETIAKIVASKTGVPSPKKGKPAGIEGILKMQKKMKFKRWYNNGTNVVFCEFGKEPEGYVAGRKSLTLRKEAA